MTNPTDMLCQMAESEIVLSTDSELDADTDYYRCSENLIEFAANLPLNC